MRPGETVVAQGSVLATNASVQIARSNTPGWIDADLLQRSDGNLKFVVPSDWAMGTYAFRVLGDGATSRTVTLNAPDSWWVLGHPGSAIRTKDQPQGVVFRNNRFAGGANRCEVRPPGAALILPAR